MPTPAYDLFREKVSSYIRYNYILLGMTIVQLILLISIVPSQLLCRQGLVIGFYNIGAQVLACLAPICCIYAAKSNKNFNTVLAYCVLVIVAKVIQIAVLISFSHVGTCALPAIDRAPVAVYSGLELGCLAISAWILKRIKRVDRQSKAITLIKNKQFLSD